MDSLKWRKPAKCVAIVDLTLLTLLLLLQVILVPAVFDYLLSSSSSTQEGNGVHHFEEPKREGSTPAIVISATSMAFIWVGLTIAVIFTLVQFWASFKLLNATKIGEEIDQSLKGCRIWRNSSIAYVIFLCGDGLLKGDYIACLVILVIRGGFFWVVYQFMEDLDLLLKPIPVQISENRGISH